MKITWNWLSEFVDLTLPVDVLAERLTMSGFEVESIEPRGRELADVVCAEIVRVRPHAQAEQLTICDIRAGGDAGAAVVCGAPNVHAGDRVAYALPGSRLPDGRAVEVAEIRGVASAGMLCSEAELGLGSDAAGLLILPGDSALGERVSTILGLEDTVLDIAVTPNRGDCLSILGMAREIAALTGQRMLRQRLSVRESDEATADLIAIRIAAPDLCGRYVGRVVSNVTIAPSPLWMQYRLQAVGLRPINHVVDVTNYVLIERGQPLHAFDYDRLPRAEIVVRRAGADASFTTLDGQTRTLHADDLLITTGDVPVAIAGIMGGADTEVTANTRRVLLESAWFAPASIRRTAKRLGLRTEASFRFERSTDIEGVALAADRAAASIAALSGGRVAKGRVDVYPSARPSAPISLRLKRVEDLLGMPVARGDVVSRLKALGLSVSPATRGTLTAVPPSYRSDLSREIDVIEEIVRLGGYENVPTTVPESSAAGTGEGREQRRQRDLKRVLCAQGLNEVVPMSFCSSRLNGLFPGLGGRHHAVPVLNPVTQEEPELRLSLCGGLARIIRDNLDQGASQVGIFSVGKVFWRADGEFLEGRRIAGGLSNAVPSTGLDSGKTITEFADVKGVVETVLDFLAVREARWFSAADLPAFHPGQSARVEVGGTLAGIAGRLHPSMQDELKIDQPCWIFELDLERLLEYSPTRVVYQELPRFPAVVRDLAVVTEDGFASDQVVHFVREWGKASHLIEDIHVFDQYVGPPIAAGKKSLAYSIAYRAPDRTLTDAEVNEVHAQLIAAIKSALPVEPR
jgi:phenylalanyl-tRNA synthetase beta chain